MALKLEVKNLSMKYSTKVVLDSINFSVEDGEFLSILGPSGCGKTTILRILIGLLKPTQGIVLKDGQDIINLQPSKRKMGIVFQNYALFENMTILENVQYALKLDKDYRQTSRQTAEALIAQVGLTPYQNRKPHSLSGGQQQRVAIARTLALNPEIILFDEPMSALDVATRLSLRDEIKTIQKKYGTTMIYITHDQEEAFAMSDRIMVMEEARIHQIDKPLDIINHPADAYVKEFVIDNLQAKIDSLVKYMDIDKLTQRNNIH